MMYKWNLMHAASVSYHIITSNISSKKTEIFIVSFTSTLCVLYKVFVLLHKIHLLLVGIDVCLQVVGCH